MIERRTWISSSAKLILHPANSVIPTDTWGIAVYEVCNCPDEDHEGHWMYQSPTLQTLEEAFQVLKSFWFTAWQ